MKFKYTGQGHTNVKFEGKKYEVLENEILEIECKKDFAEYLVKNHFIELKMEDEINTIKVEVEDIVDNEVESKKSSEELIKQEIEDEKVIENIKIDEIKSKK